MSAQRSFAGFCFDMRLRAQGGSYDGTATPANRAYLSVCNRVWRYQSKLLASATFSRDAGMHACGWWKNPDYERCYHLSLCFQAPGQGGPQPHDHKLALEWIKELFGESRRYIWTESPFSDHGKRLDIYHYRCFMAPDWKTPIVPRGEVYTREFTEAGWKSWSDQHGDDCRLLDAREQP